MKRTNIFISMGAALLALAVAVPVALSHGPGPGPDGDREAWRGKRMERMAEKLNLDDQQKAKLEAIRNDHQADAQSLREQMRSARDAIRQLWTQPNVTKQQIVAAEAEVRAIEGQLAESRIDFLFKAKGVLSADQFSRFVEMQQRHFGRHHRGGKGGGWGKGFGPPPSPDVTPDTE